MSINRYYLNKDIIYRIEDGYILVCDCRNLRNYAFPLDYYNEFECLKKGTIIDLNLDIKFYKDLFTLKMLETINQSCGKQDSVYNEEFDVKEE